MMRTNSARHHSWPVLLISFSLYQNSRFSKDLHPSGEMRRKRYPRRGIPLWVPAFLERRGHPQGDAPTRTVSPTGWRTFSKFFLTNLLNRGIMTAFQEEDIEWNRPVFFRSCRLA